MLVITSQLWRWRITNVSLVLNHEANIYITKLREKQHNTPTQPRCHSDRNQPNWNQFGWLECAACVSALDTPARKLLRSKRLYTNFVSSLNLTGNLMSHYVTSRDVQNNFVSQLNLAETFTSHDLNERKQNIKESLCNTGKSWLNAKNLVCSPDRLM